MANYKPKTCAWCGTKFTPDHPSRTYCTPNCRKSAKTIRSRKNNLEYRQENRERINEQKRNHYKNNKPRLRRHRREYYAANKESTLARVRKYQKENKEAISKRKREYRQANIEHIREKDRKYYEANRTQKIAQTLAWQARNQDKVDAIRARRAKVILEGNAKPSLIEAKWEAGDKTCILCGNPIDPNLPPSHRMGRTIEHLTPIHRGGRHDLDNIDFAHHSCNASKGAKTLEEYQAWQVKLRQAS